jgi:LmbE family N-acetylglucosaminyl deacetylase
METKHDIIPGLGTVLGIWAHPDDETFLSAGLMAAAIDAGQRVVTLTATLGEAGGSPAENPAAVAARRSAELDAALAVLGVREHHVADLPDGGCATVAHATGVALVRDAILRVRPDTILTFGPDGVTGHPDHQAVNRWVWDAWVESGADADLLYASMPTGFGIRHRRIHEQLNAFEPGHPVETSPQQLSLRWPLDDEQLDRKYRALRAHDSQTSSIEAIIGRDALRTWWREECFRPATTTSRHAERRGMATSAP